MKVKFGPDWSEFVTLLLVHRVRFVLVGGHAFAGHAEPRLTEDLDVFVEPTLANAVRLRRALVDFGFEDSAPSTEALAVPGKIVVDYEAHVPGAARSAGAGGLAALQYRGNAPSLGRTRPLHRRAAPAPSCSHFTHLAST